MSVPGLRTSSNVPVEPSRCMRPDQGSISDNGSKTYHSIDSEYCANVDTSINVTTAVQRVEYNTVFSPQPVFNKNSLL